MTIKAVFFDAAGTLIEPVRRVGESYAAIAAKYGKSVPPAEIAARFRLCFDVAPRLAFPDAAAESLATLERDWWRRLVAHVFEPWNPFQRFEEYFDELFSYFATPAAWQLYPEVTETLLGLRRRGLILGVISNFDSRLVGILAGLGAGRLFEEIVVSSRIGYAKPHPEIFRIALSRHGLRPENAIHVGDSPINDLQGARNAGLRAVLVARENGGRLPKPDRVTSLRDILAMVEAS